MYLMKKFMLALCLAGCAIGAQAQTLTISDETAGSPDTQAVSINYTAGATDLASFSVRIDYDPALLTPQTDMAANPNVNGCVADLPASHTGAFTACNNPTAGAIALTVTDQFSGTVLPTTSVGSITFDVAPGLSPGTVSPVEMTFLSATTDTGAALAAGDLTLTDGSITVNVPPGESFFNSNPVPGSTIDFGSAVVGQATSPDETITVSNASTDTAFDVTGAAGNFAVGSGSYSLTSPALPATVAASGSVDFDVNCTPLGRGNNTGTYTLTTDADNVTTADYPTICTGLSPNVQVPAGPVALSSTVAGADPTANITVTNPQDGFTSTANGVTATAGAGSPEITVTTGGPTNISPDGSFDFAVSCDSSAEGNFSRTIDFSWTDPVGPGADSIQVDCTVSDTAPIYNSDPVPGSSLALVTAANTQSAPDGLDINNANTNPAGDNLTISSATASDPVFTVNVINSSFAPNVGPDGVDDIEVTCTPPGVGTINGTLTVQTNDPNEPGGGFTYPLSCEGTGDALTTNPDNGGTLNLGTVPPGTTTGEGLISFTNNQIDGDITVDCSVMDTAGVFTFTPDPILFTIPAGDTESAAFQCTPSDISSFTADVSCTLPVRGQGLNFTVACAGRPLVIPTMSRWGLVVMSLVLLLVAGVAGRRMLA